MLNYMIIMSHNKSYSRSLILGPESESQLSIAGVGVWRRAALTHDLGSVHCFGGASTIFMTSLSCRYFNTV